jgi:hypothetical protein
MADIANITLKGESEAKNFIDEALRGDIAYEELSTTVSKTGGYVAGDHLIYLGQYYEVVADIAQGGTIVTSGAGQNVEEREVGDEIKKNKTQVLGVICDVETSPATAAHSAGDQFYYDGALVEATSAIAIGDTIVVFPDTGYNVKVADKVVAQIETLTNRVEGNWSGGGKNLLPIKYSKITSYGLTWEKSNDGYIIINGTSTASPAQQSLFDATPVVITPSQGTIISLKELGIDGTKKYIFSRDTKIENVRPRIDLWSDSAKLLEVELSNNDGLYKEIDFSQYPTCTGIKATIQVSLNTTVTNAIQKIMLCSKEWYDVDSTYQSYAKTNQQLTEDTTALLDNLEVNGAVNMLPNNVTTQTINGITFTVNNDGTVTANGTATDNAELTLNTSGTSSAIKGLETGNYKLSGCPSGGGNNTYRLFAKGTNNTYYNDDGNGALISNTGIAYVRILIKSGQTVSNLTFKPMITVSSYNGDYVPYAKSNKELTEDIEYYDTITTDSDVPTGITGVNAFRKGDIVQLLFNGTFNIIAGQNNDIGTLPLIYRPVAEYKAWVATNEASPKFTQARIFNNGHIEVNGWMISGSVTLNGTYMYVGTDY